MFQRPIGDQGIKVARAGVLLTKRLVVRTPIVFARVLLHNISQPVFGSRARIAPETSLVAISLAALPSPPSSPKTLADPRARAIAAVEASSGDETSRARADLGGSATAAAVNSASRARARIVPDQPHCSAARASHWFRRRARAMSAGRLLFFQIYCRLARPQSYGGGQAAPVFFARLRRCRSAGVINIGTFRPQHGQFSPGIGRISVAGADTIGVAFTAGSCVVTSDVTATWADTGRQTIRVEALGSMAMAMPSPSDSHRPC